MENMIKRQEVEEKYEKCESTILPGEPAVSILV
jgi:hypothetical protein